MDAETLASALAITLVAVSIVGLIVLDRRIRLRLGHENTVRFVELGAGIFGFVVGGCTPGIGNELGALAFVFGIELVLVAIRKVPNPADGSDAATPSEGEGRETE